MNELFIYTETTCANIANVCINSFHKHHDRKLHIITTPDVFKDIEPHKNNVLIDVSKDADLSERFMKGIEGVAWCYGKVLSKEYTDCDRILHFDSDVYFKKECVNYIEKLFDEGFDLMGTRRTYVNNPGKVKGLEGLQDVVSTYFLAVNLKKFTGYDSATIAKMWQCNYPYEHRILDTFDIVSFIMLKGGANIKYLDFEMFGGQNEHGKKTNKYISNLHLDCGSAILHWAGVECGKNHLEGKGNHVASYGEWAGYRYLLFKKIFFNEEIKHRTETVFDDMGRWISGSHNEEILNQILKDMKL